MKAKKKPVVIDFFDYNNNNMNVILWTESLGDPFYNNFVVADDELYVRTLEGTSYAVTANDMILRGVSGEYYPCKKNIFYNTYEVLPDERDRNR